MKKQNPAIFTNAAAIASVVFVGMAAIGLAVHGTSPVESQEGLNQVVVIWGLPLAVVFILVSIQGVRQEEAVKRQSCETSMAAYLSWLVIGMNLLALDHPILKLLIMSFVGMLLCFWIGKSRLGTGYVAGVEWGFLPVFVAAPVATWILSDDSSWKGIAFAALAVFAGFITGRFLVLRAGTKDVLTRLDEVITDLEAPATASSPERGGESLTAN